jgi:hypothetical protein
MRTTKYPLQVKNEVEAIVSSYTEDEYLNLHQFINKEYFVKKNVRGILLFHSPGYGKTYTAVSISEYYRKMQPRRKIIVISPKSLRANFEQSITGYMKYAEGKKSAKFADVSSAYNFISLNASNMFTQITKVGTQKEFDDIYDSEFLENSLVIIDEYHNLSNSITNHSTNAIKLYRTIMNTKNIKLLFMTGTPIVNDPFELVPTFNMLRGHKVFPERMDDFMNYFVDRAGESYSIKNKNKFQNRAFGMVSYYGTYYFSTKKKEDFPDEYPLIVERVPMSSAQYMRYKNVREIEIMEEKYKKSTGAMESFSVKDSSANSSSYRVRSRQASNVGLPDSAFTIVNGKKTKDISSITLEDIRQSGHRMSPKFMKVIENIKKSPSTIGIVYSEFISGEGLLLLGRYLEALEGYSLHSSGGMDDFDMVNRDGRTYALIYGDVPFDQRKEIVKTFNKPENADGSLISLLLISKTGAEGLSLHNVRHVHIIEPFWNYARIEQVIARGVRYRSHLGLPEDQRNVQPYIYLSVYPEKMKIKLDEEHTTDETLYVSAVSKKKLIAEFERALIEISIDCSAHYSSLQKSIQDTFKCRLCMPSEDALYTADFYKDMTRPDKCKAVQEQKAKVDAITVTIGDEEKTFYYKKKGHEVVIYMHDPMLDAYVPMKRSYPHYSTIAMALLDK